MSTLIELSRQEFTGTGSHEDIQAGCLQRIADSLERIERPYLRLLEEVERSKRSREFDRQYNLRLSHQIAGLKGYIKRMKNKG